MLIDVDTMKPITRVPFERDFQTLRGRLTDDEFGAMKPKIIVVSRFLNQTRSGLLLP